MTDNFQCHIYYLDQIILFGKYKNMLFEDIIEQNPSYIDWMVEHFSDFIVAQEVRKDIEDMFPSFKIPSNMKFLPREEMGFYDFDNYIEDDEITDNDYQYEQYEQYEHPTYERYNGSYAQDEMGYSDDDIDTIFDGDPSAYWNID